MLWQWLMAAPLLRLLALLDVFLMEDALHDTGVCSGITKRRLIRRLVGHLAELLSALRANAATGARAPRLHESTLRNGSPRLRAVATVHGVSSAACPK
jgi:hypothetical protein